MLERGLTHYASAGITTARDGALGPGAVSLLAAMAGAGKLPIDVVGYARHASADESLLAAIARDGKAPSRFRLAGVEISIDGSLSGYSAYLSRPYTTPPKAQDVLGDLCDNADLEHGFVSRLTPLARGAVPSPASGSGVADMTQDEVTNWVRRCDAQGVQLTVHANGDAALDRLAEAIKTVRGDQSRPTLRTVIKNEIMREDQVDFVARHALLPTFAPMPLFYRNPRQRDAMIGADRAERVAPAADCLRRNIKFTLHHDAPIAGAHMLPLVAVAINRVAVGGRNLSAGQRVTTFAAFRAITADAAWQCFEEQRKGTLEAGKLADLVILSNDPFLAPQDKIGQIRVMETIKEGKVVFRRA
jgi:predicted amidohydrolase YtcJ